MADERGRGPLQCWSGRPSEQQDRNAGTAQRVHAVLQAEVVEAQQRGGRRPRCAGSSDPPQAAKLRVRRRRPQRLAAAHDDIQPALQLLAVAGVHPPGTQFFQRHGAADAALAGQQVALYLCATHRGVRQRPRRDHGMGTPTPPAAQPQDRYQLLVQILLVAAVLPQPGAAARRTPHPLEYPLPAISELSEVVVFLGNIEYQYRTGGRETGWCPTMFPGLPSSLCSVSPTAKR